jgi:hypothetical protein
LLFALCTIFKKVDEEQHRIPQQISSYQFRLIGDMTLKQFFQVAAGALISVIIYSTTLPSFIKWPAIVLSFLTGVAFAFFPLEDRPLSKWLILFIKSIYSPTMYIWKKLTRKPKYFQSETTQQASDTQLPATLAISDQPTTPPTDQKITKESSKFEAKEEEFLSKITQQFKSPPLPEARIITYETKQEDEVEQKSIEPSEQEKRGVGVLDSTPIKVEKMQKRDYLEGKPHTTTSAGTYVTPVVGQKSEGAQAAQFFQDGTAPTPPTIPNIIVGQVVDDVSKIVEAAILEIKDADGRPVRALRSNKLGHFMIVTPLLDGKYEIVTEKQGLVFDPVYFDAKGEIIPPIAIKAREKINEQVN